MYQEDAGAQEDREQEHVVGAEEEQGDGSGPQGGHEREAGLRTEVLLQGEDYEQGGEDKGHAGDVRV